MSSNNNNNNDSSITIRKNGNGIVAEMTVAAGTQRVWRILTSFDEMDAHLSGLKTSKVLRTEGNSFLVEQMTKVGISLLSFSFRVVMDVVEDRPYLYFNQRPGFADNLLIDIEDFFAIVPRLQSAQIEFSQEFGKGLAEFVALLEAEFFPVRGQHPPGELPEIKSLQHDFPEFLPLDFL